MHETEETGQQYSWESAPFLSHQTQRRAPTLPVLCRLRQEVAAGTQGQAWNHSFLL